MVFRSVDVGESAKNVGKSIATGALFGPAGQAGALAIPAEVGAMVAGSTLIGGAPLNRETVEEAIYTVAGMRLTGVAVNKLAKLGEKPSRTEFSEATGLPVNELPNAEQRAAAVVEAKTIGEANATGEVKAGEEATGGRTIAQGETAGQAQGQETAPIDPVLDPSNFVSTKKAIMDRERATRDLDPTVQAMRRTAPEMIAKATDIYDNQPEKVDAAIAEIVKDPRPARDWEVGAFQLRNREFIIAFDEAVAKLEEAKATGDPLKIADAETTERVAFKTMDDFGQFTRVPGGEWGRSGAAQQFGVDYDTGILSLMRRERESLGVEKLPKEVEAIVKEDYAKLSKARTKYEDLVKSDIDAKVEQAVAEETKKVVETEKKERSNRTAKIQKEIDSFWTDFEKKYGGTTFSNPLPVVVDLVKVAGLYAEKGVAKFGDFYDDIKIRFGEQRAAKLRDQAEGAWKHAQEDHAAAEAKRQTARLKQLETRKAFWQDKLDRGDLDPIQRRKLPTNPAIDKARLELEAIHRKVADAREARRRAKFTTQQKVFEGAREWMNLARANMVSFDVSYMARHGGAFLASHPIEAAKAFGKTFGTLWSEAKASREAYEITQLEGYKSGEFKRAGLELTERGGKLTGQEEGYMSRLARKLPWVHASERAFVSFLNRIRVVWYESLKRSLGANTEAQQKIIANFVNIATGRGNLGRFQGGAETLATAFFAPRYALSRFQLLLGRPFWKADFATRKLIAIEYARAITGVGLFLGASATALNMLMGPPSKDKDGWSIELDPRSSDFGKIRIGASRIDPLFGLSQVTRLVTQVATGQKKTAKGKIVPIRGDKIPFGSPNTADTIGRFARTKLAPVVSSFIDLAAGTDVVGQPATPGSVALKTMTPISLQNIYEAMKAEGVEKGAALGLLDLFGMSLNTYAPYKKKKRNAA